MAKKDTIAPTAINKNLEVTKLTDRSISIRWEKAKDDNTAAEEIRYVVGLTEAENADDPWHIVCEEKDICEYTFTELKPSTSYAFYVMAYDEAGNATQYPVTDGSMTAKTRRATEDRYAPTVPDKTIEVAEIKEDRISIKWQKAKDDLTPAKDIRYIVGLTEAENPLDPWHIVADAKDIGKLTLKDLKGDTLYAFYVNWRTSTPPSSRRWRSRSRTLPTRSA